MRIIPMKNKVLLRIPSAAERKVGHIIIPSHVSMGEKHLVGEVIEIGPPKVFNNGSFLPIEVEIGDKVVVGQFAGTRLHIDDKLHMTVDATEIMAIITEE